MFQKVLFAILAIVISATTFSANAQEADSIRYSVENSIVENQSHHSPKVATLLSAAIPGAGQIYNLKIWKAPIIYAGFGGLAYGTSFYNKEYKTYRDLYREAKDSETQTAEKDGKTYKVGNLQEARNFYRKGRDLCIIGICLWYTINIIDANVDAHFFDYDISDDLSLHISPILTPIESKNTLGLNICLNLK